LMKQPTLWFCDYNKQYAGNEPFLYPASEIDIAVALEQYYTSLLEELKILWQTKNGGKDDLFGDYASYDDKQFPPNSWKKMVIKVWGIKNKSIYKKFPVTSSLVERFPNVTSCYVTRTSAHSIIRPHCGETNAIIRIHLGLKVPEVDAGLCGMQIGSQTVAWKNGKAFAFLDAHSHHVWNNSDHDRYVVIADVLRPEFTGRKNFICSRIIVGQLFFSIATRFNTHHLHKVPNRLLDGITWLLYLPIVAAVKLNNRIGFLKL
jgi:ornithine lipid ester-linked acyl 2-hydroxylase